MIIDPNSTLPLLDINTTIAVIEPIAVSINSFVSLIKLLVGGVFGLYLILVFLKWMEDRRMNRLIRVFNKELKKLNESIELLNANLGKKKKKVKKKRK